MAVRTKLVIATSPRAKQCTALERTSTDECRISRPLIRVTTTAATSHTNSSDRITAVCWTMETASPKLTCWMSSPPNGFVCAACGAASIAVTSDPATSVRGRKSRPSLCIDSPRCAPQQKYQDGVHGDEEKAEADLCDGRCAADGGGRRVDGGPRHAHRPQGSLDHAQRGQAGHDADHDGDGQ